MTKRKVLIPLDGLAFSHQIVPIVRSWFKPQDVALVLFHVGVLPRSLPNPTVSRRLVGDLPTGGLYAAYSEEMDRRHALTTQEVETRRAELEAVLRQEADLLSAAGYLVTTKVCFGEPARRIIELVQSEQIELIAMTTHGRTGLGRLVMGSVAESVARAVNVPVLLWRPTTQPGEAQPTAGEALAQKLRQPHALKLAVVTDGSTFGQKAVAVATNLASQLDAQLTPLVVANERDSLEHSQQVMQEVRQLVEKLTPPPAVVPLVGYADEVVLQYLDKNPVDLLVLGAFRDRGAGSPTAIGTMAHRLAQYAPTSVLICKGHAPKLARLLACAAVDDDLIIDVASHLTQALGAQLDVLHVAPAETPYPEFSKPTSEEIPLDEVLEQDASLAKVMHGWLQQLKSMGINQEHVFIRRGQAADAILEVAKAGGYELLITGSQSGAGFFLGSVANHVVSFAEQSVLVVRTRPE